MQDEIVEILPEDNDVDIWNWLALAEPDADELEDTQAEEEFDKSYYYVVVSQRARVHPISNLHTSSR